MSLSLTNESKNSITITNIDKAQNTMTWNEATMSWNDATFTWDSPRVILSKESKNNLSISNEAKN